jgi:hypothetical protein
MEKTVDGCTSPDTAKQATPIKDRRTDALNVDLGLNSFSEMQLQILLNVLVEDANHLRI